MNRSQSTSRGRKKIITGNTKIYIKTKEDFCLEREATKKKYEGRSNSMNTKKEGLSQGWGYTKKKRRAYGLGM